MSGTRGPQAGRAGWSLWLIEPLAQARMGPIAGSSPPDRLANRRWRWPAGTRCSPWRSSSRSPPPRGLGVSATASMASELGFHDIIQLNMVDVAPPEPAERRAPAAFWAATRGAQPAARARARGRAQDVAANPAGCAVRLGSQSHRHGCRRYLQPLRSRQRPGPWPPERRAAASWQTEASYIRPAARLRKACALAIGVRSRCAAMCAPPTVTGVRR